MVWNDRVMGLTCHMVLFRRGLDDDDGGRGVGDIVLGLFGLVDCRDFGFIRNGIGG